MTYIVCIDYKSGLAVERVLEAASEHTAQADALRFAKQCGFTGQVKKITVRPA